MRKAKKWLSILLTMSLLTAVIIIPSTTASALAPIADRELLYSQDFNDPSTVKLNDNWGDGISETEVWSGYNSPLELAQRSKGDTDDLCLVRPNLGVTCYTIFTLPFEMTNADDTTYEISFDYYAAGNEIFYAGHDTYVRLQGSDTLAANQWHDIKMILNVKRKIFIVNDIPLSPGATFADSFRFIQFATGAGCDAKFDNFKICKCYLETMPINYSVTTISNERFNIADGDTVVSGINELRVKFDSQLQNDSADGLLSLKTDDTEVEAESTISGDTITLKPFEPLKADTDYVLTVNNGIISSENVASKTIYNTFFRTDGGNVVAKLSKNAGNPAEKEYIKIYENKFDSDSDYDVVPSGMGITELNIVDEKNGYLTISPNKRKKAFTLNFGKSVEAGASVRVSFDYKSPSIDAVHPQVQFFESVSGGNDKYSGKFNLYGENIKGSPFEANQWQRYFVEIYANKDGKTHKLLIYRINGDGLTEVDYINQSTDLNLSGISLCFDETLSGEENYQFVDNIRIEKKKQFIYEDFTKKPQYILAPNNKVGSGLIDHGNMSVVDGMLVSTGADEEGEILLDAGLARVIGKSEGEMEICFNFKSEKENSVCFELSDGMRNSDTYSLSSDAIFGGESFETNKWQKYHIVISLDDSGNKLKLWRGDSSDYSEAKVVDLLPAQLNGIVEALFSAEEDADGNLVYIDDFSWTFYEEGKEPISFKYASAVTAEVKNTMGSSYEGYIIYSAYSSDGRLIGTQYMPIMVEPYEIESFTMEFDEPASMDIHSANAYLWKLETSHPSCEMISIK